jgi:mono/diheme cytochrome c family protein
MASTIYGSLRRALKSLLRIRTHTRILFCATLVFGGQLSAQEERGPAPPDGDGKELFAMVCSQCHSLKSTLIMRDGQKGWERVVNTMVLYGAQLSPPEADRITRYLTTQLGPGSAPAPTRIAASRTPSRIAPTPASLPEGPGRELVAERCSLCHTLEKVVSSNRSTAEWRATTLNMQQRGMQATADEMQTMTSYLEAHFSQTAPTHSQPHPSVQ